MAKYGSFLYEAEKYGVGHTSGNLLWSLRVLWDGIWWGPNEAHGRMIDLNVKRGRQSLLASGGQGLESFGVGEAVLILDNADRRFDPFNTDGAVYPDVRPGKFARLEVIDDSTDTTYSIMRGIIDDIQPEKQGELDTVRIVIKDGLQWLKDRVLNLGLQESVDKNAIFDSIYAAVDWPTTEWPITRTADTDPQDFWWAWNQGALQAMEEFNKAEWAVTYHDRDGNLTWRPNSYGQEQMIEVYQDEILTDIGRPQPWEVVRNIVRVTSSPKVLDDVDAILWQLQSVPAILDTATFFIEPIFRYSDWTPCGDDVTFDFTVNAEAGGGGADLSGGCTLVAGDEVGEGARLTLTNNSGSDGYITLLKATGDAVYPPSTDIREEEDTTSQADYGARSLMVDSRWVEDTEYAQTLADWLLDNLKDPNMLPIIQLEDQLVQQYTPDLYDKIILRLPDLKLRQVFRVGHIEHEWLNENGQSVLTTMRLEPYLVEDIISRNESHNGTSLSFTSALTVQDDTWTVCTWTVDLWNGTANFFTAPSTNITIPVGLTGYFRISTRINWEASAAGTRGVRIWRTTDPEELAIHLSPSPGNAIFTQAIDKTVYLEAGDIIQVWAYQDSGGALDTYEINGYSPVFGIEFLGAG